MRRPSAHTTTLIRDVLNGPALRQIIGYADSGEIAVVYIGNPAGGSAHEPHEKGHDIFTHVVDALTEVPLLGRLFVPAGIVFRRPKDGETAHLVRGRDAAGAALVVPDGSDGNTDDYLPAWLDDDNCGIYSTDETLHIESKKQDVVINAGGAQIRITKDGAISIDAKDGQVVALQGGGSGVARKDDPVVVSPPMAGWMGAVEKALNVLSVGAVTVLSDSFASSSGIGKIGQASTKTTCG